ncbi:MAG: hypothetical protein E7B34_14120 [Hafnia alvei]|nr:hypothetical protein [Hafnia alvei]
MCFTCSPNACKPHGGDDLRAGVVSVSGGRYSCTHLGRLQNVIQLGDFLRPAAGGRTIRAGKRFLDAAPAYVFGEHGLSVACRLPISSSFSSRMAAMLSR